MFHERLKALVALAAVAAAWPSAAGAAPASEPEDLLAGAAWRYSTDGGKSFSDKPSVVAAEQTVELTAVARFTVADPSRYAVLELTHGLPAGYRPTFMLNGKQVAGPMEGMFYRTIPAIDPRVLQKGENVLQARAAVRNVSRGRRKAADVTVRLTMSLAALRPDHLRFQTGPILGAMDAHHVSVTCRTNMPAGVRLHVRRAGKAEPASLGEPAGRSALGLIHRFRVRRADAGREEYVLAAEQGPARAVSRPFRPPPAPSGAWRFVVMGDSRTNVDDWAKVAAAVAKQQPGLVVFVGDMVSNGRDDWRWDNEFFGPGQRLFATIPFYAVIGNHEKDAPLYNEIFYTPGGDGRGRNWQQRVGGVLLIGIDGREDWSAGSANATWLAKTLAASKARFIFLASHYPAWSSSKHGRLDEDGRPRETAVRQGQDLILPLLAKYKAAAMFAGHDHVYERSEPPGGVSMIITGGAGAPRYQKVEAAAKQNPHSKAFAGELNYCLLEVKDDICTMKALTPDDRLIDTRHWKARAVGQAAAQAAAGGRKWTAKD